MAISDDKNDFLTTREAAKRLGVALSTVQGWVETGVLKAWKTPGGHRRIPASIVESIRTRQLEVFVDNPPSERMKVLVVEDDETQRDIYRLQFEKLDIPIELHMAENGFQGLIMYGRYEPHLIITDLAMPEMDGFRMIQELAMIGIRAQSIIVVTGLTEEEITANGGVQEGIDVLSKPLAFQQLADKLEVRFKNLSHLKPSLNGTHK